MKSYRAIISVEECSITVMLNGFPVFKSPGASPIDATVPIGFAMATGINEFQVDIKAANSHSAAHCDVVLVSYSKQREDSEPSQLVSIAYRLGDANPVQLSSPAGLFPNGVSDPIILSQKQDSVQITRNFRLEEPIPRWNWLDSERIEDNTSTRSSLLKVYHYIWSMLSQRSTSSFEQIFLERTTEYRIAFGATADEFPGDRGFGSVLKEPGMELYPWDPDDGRFELLGKSRLARYTREDGTPLIVFVDGRIGRYFDIIFRLDRGRWMPTR